MPDPMDALLAPTAPIAPRAEFATDLRGRIERALGGPPPPENHVERHDQAQAGFVPAHLHSITPYLSTDDGAAALAWYQNVFGAELLGEPFVMPDGRIGHAELRIGDSAFFLAGEHPPENVRSPQTLGGTTVQLTLYVEDAAAVLDRAVAAGADVWRPVRGPEHGAISGKVRDPFGHNWFLSTHVAAGGHRPGEPSYPLDEVGYYTISVPDVERGRRFYGGLFGWRFGPTGDSSTGHRYAHIENTQLPVGLHDDPAGEGPHLYYRVADVGAAADRVRELGGTVDSIEFGWQSGGGAECHDDQGIPFSLWQPAPGY